MMRFYMMGILIGVLLINVIYINVEYWEGGGKSE